MRKLYGLSIFEINIPTLFRAYQARFTFRYYLLRIAVSTASIKKTINDPLNHFVTIIYGSYDDFQLLPILESCHSHSIPCTEGPPPPDYLTVITEKDDLFTVSIHVDNLSSHSLIIELPPNAYRLKVQNKYIPLDYGTEIYGGIFDYTHFGKSMFKPTTDWTNHKRTDMIPYIEEIDRAELEKAYKLIQM